MENIMFFPLLEISLRTPMVQLVQVLQVLKCFNKIETCCCCCCCCWTVDLLACWCSFAVMIGRVTEVWTLVKGISPRMDSALGSTKLNSRCLTTSWGSRARLSPGDRDLDLEKCFQIIYLPFFILLYGI